MKFIQVYKNLATLEKKFRKVERKPALVLKISTKVGNMLGLKHPPPPPRSCLQHFRGLCVWKLAPPPKKKKTVPLPSIIIAKFTIRRVPQGVLPHKGLSIMYHYLTYLDTKSLKKKQKRQPLKTREKPKRKVH